MLVGGDNDDCLIPIMINCPWPADNHRRGIIYLKPSIPIEEFCTAVNDMFGMINNGMVCLKASIRWMNENPYHYPHLATSVGVSDYPSTWPTVEQDFRMIGKTMNGVYAMHIIAPVNVALQCNGCHQTMEDPFFARMLRLTLSGLIIKCEECVQRGLFAMEA